MNLPNKLTLSRIILAAFFMSALFSGLPYANALALMFFLVASATDYWDGEIARRRGQITRFGKWMDPVADKVLTLSAFIGFVQLGIIPAWMVVMIIARDLLITGFRFFIPPDSDRIAAGKSGKHKTAIQFGAIVGILVVESLRSGDLWSLSWDPAVDRAIYSGMCLVVAVTLGSGIWYVVRNRDLFMKHKSEV